MDRNVDTLVTPLARSASFELVECSSVSRTCSVVSIDRLTPILKIAAGTVSPVL
jgi:hypothetical protein